MRQIETINTYLWFGYVPANTFPRWYFDCFKNEYRGTTYCEREAGVVFDELFDRLLSSFANRSGNHVVPLSGGWDSRAILAALMQRLPRERIRTVTFGCPGQLDYEIGQAVAKSCGVKNYLLDLREVEMNWESLVESAEDSPWLHMPDAMFNKLAQHICSSEGDVVWSGFLGDFRGSHLVNTDYTRVEHIKYFVDHEQCCRSIRLAGSKFQPSQCLNPLDTISADQMGDALSFGFRLPCGIAPIMLPVKRLEGWNSFTGTNANGADVVAPFANAKWAGYWLQAPVNVRIGQKIYLKMLRAKYPDLFMLPSRPGLGINQDARWLYRSVLVKEKIKARIENYAPWMRIRATRCLNYIDYNHMFRTSMCYQDVLDHAIDYLERRKLVEWIDMRKMRLAHIRRLRNYGDAFLLLIGLAANIEANGMGN